MSTLNEGLYALAYDEDIHCLATLVGSFKLAEVYREHGFTVVNSYQRPPPQESVYDTVTPRSMPQNDSSTPAKDFVCESVTPRCMPQHDSSTHVKDSIYEFITPRCMPHGMLTPPTNQVIKDVMWQLSFEETKLDGEAGLGDVTGSGIDNSGLSHDESFGFYDLDLNVNITRDLNVSHTETQEEVHVSEIPVSEGRVNEILDGSDEEDVIHGSGEEDFEHGNGPESVKETSGTYHDDGDEDDDILVDEENKIVEPDVDVHLFDIRKDVPCDNIGVTSLILDDVLKGEDLDVVNPDGFNSDKSDNW
ncbi:hypothetical protein Tco_1325499 [Tanacetum coccineum]